MSASQDPTRLDNEIRPVVWTPEDAARFLTSAIHESQRPLAEALRQRPVTSRALALIVFLIAGAAAVIAWMLQAQLAKSELAAEKALQARDAESGRRTELLADIAHLQAKLDLAHDDNSRLKAETASLREGEEELRRARSESQRLRRQGELLRGQLSGLEMEKTALARQLEALKAYALEEYEGETVAPGPAAPSGGEKIGISGLGRPAAAEPAEPTAPAVSLILETPASALAVTGDSAVAAGLERRRDAGAAEAAPKIDTEVPAPNEKLGSAASETGEPGGSQTEAARPDAAETKAAARQDGSEAESGDAETPAEARPDAGGEGVSAPEKEAPRESGAAPSGEKQAAAENAENGANGELIR